MVRRSEEALEDWGEPRIFLSRAALVVGILSALLAVAHARAYFFGDRSPGPFVTFYCGGRVALSGSDPYRLEPLLSCETALSGDGKRLTLGGFMPYGSPVPLPPYDFAPLSLLALAPLGLAKAIFGSTQLLAIAAIAYALAKLSKLPLGIAFGVAFFGIGYQSQLSGQLPLFAIAALVLAALAFKGERYTTGAIAVCASLVQPQFGLPAVLGAFLLYPAARKAIVVAIAALIVLGLPFGGIVRIAEFAKVLPLHARAEISYSLQYSLAFFAHQLGANDTTALTLGTISYAALLALALALIACNREAARATGAAVLLPSAFAVFGGTFIHIHQIAAAVPIAVTIHNPKFTAPAAALALTWLIIPWTRLASNSLTMSVDFGISLALVTAGAAIYFLNRELLGRRVSATLALACVSITLAVFGVLHANRPSPARTIVNKVIPPADPTGLGSLSWAQGIRIVAAEQPGPGTAAYAWTNLYVKYPTWLALLILVPSVSLALAYTRKSDALGVVHGES